MSAPRPRPPALLALWAIVLAACASSRHLPGGTSDDPLEHELAGPGEAPSRDPGPSAPPSTTGTAPGAGASGVCDSFVQPGVLRREVVVQAVDRGLGQWLSGVRVSPVRQGRRFAGWRVDRLYPGDPCYRALDLLPGDVVTRVNGSALERPEQANDVFQSLRSAPRLEVELQRDGAPRRLSLAIAD